MHSRETPLLVADHINAHEEEAAVERMGLVRKRQFSCGTFDHDGLPHAAHVIDEVAPFFVLVKVQRLGARVLDGLALAQALEVNRAGRGMGQTTDQARGAGGDTGNITLDKTGMRASSLDLVEIQSIGADVTIVDLILVALHPPLAGLGTANENASGQTFTHCVIVLRAIGRCVAGQAGDNGEEDPHWKDWHQDEAGA